MGLRDTIFGAFGLGRPRVSAAAPPPPPMSPPTPDGTPFRRFNTASGHSASQLALMAATTLGQIGPYTRPLDVPWYVLDAMAFDPVIYLGEQAFAAPLRDPSLYRVVHKDPAIKAETEEWLSKILHPLLCTATRMFAYGVVPFVMDWVSEDLKIQVQRDGQAPRNRTLSQHVHYGALHEIHPADVHMVVKDDRLVELRSHGKTYRPDRAFAAVWDFAFGSWKGNGSRRRAYRAYYKSQLVDTWHGRYLERSVDPPRLGYAPEGKVKINGVEYLATELLSSAVTALKGGGAGILPNTTDPESGQREWSIEPMKLPDVSDVWHKALDWCDAKKMLASLTPPTTGGITDATFAGARVPNDMFVELVESAGSAVAQIVEQVVAVVHHVRHGDRHPAPRIKARELPRAKVKRLTELFKAVATIERRVGDNLRVTLAELVDESIIDELGIARRPTEEAAREPSANPAPGTPGPDRDSMSDRGDRRDNAREPEGEDATGASDEGIG